MRKEQFDVTGMTCSACSARVSKTVAALAGVNAVNVNLLKNSMSVEFDESALSPQAISAAVEKAGYGASPRVGKNAARTTAARPYSVNQELDALKRRLTLSAAFTLPLFYLSMGHMLHWPLPGFFLGTANALNYAFAQFLLLLPVVFINFTYFRMGFKTLCSGSPNMDSLIALGSGAAAAFGVYAIFRIGSALGAGDMAGAHSFAMNLYFESAAMILTLITLGKFLEGRAKGRTSDAIARLIDLAPKTATALRGGQEERIPLDEVRVGDMLVVKAGESVPVDGIIAEGSAWVDESSLSGESVPAEKQAGGKVTGGTVSKSGYFVMQATRVGDDTTLAQIVRLVDEASSSRAPIAKLADRISGVFVPLVIAAAASASAFWLLRGQGLEFALVTGISVLVISCPCALGLATPTAIMVGTGRGAADGILIKSAEAIEAAQRIDTVVLDKTGTVTEGKPLLTDLAPMDGIGEEALLFTALSLEKRSEHPLARAVLREGERRGITPGEVTDFLQIPGQGLIGRLDGALCLAGNALLLEAHGIAAGQTLPLAERCAADGKTVLFCSRDGALLGLLAVADVIKPSSPQAVAELTAMGIDVIMLTGDNARSAEAIGRQAGVRRVIAEVLPQDKEREIRALQAQGKKVAMVGDGVNDAPALARADLGIAIGAGTDIAIESADIVLMKSDLMDVSAAIQLGRAVMRNIHQNLFWAFFYNSVGIPVAAGALYGIWDLTLNPMIAAAAMSLSSVSVVSNALRLRLFRPVRRAAKPVCAENANGETPWNTQTASPPSTSQRSIPMNKHMRIDGMSCGHCKASVEKALRAVPGVTEATVNLAEKSAELSLGGDVTDEALTLAVTEAGFQVVSVS